MKMMLAEVPHHRSDVKYVKIDDFRKKILIALLTAGKGQVIWTKSSPNQPEKLRQIVKLDDKKYMVHFWKNQLQEIYLLEKNRGL